MGEGLGGKRDWARVRREKEGTRDFIVHPLQLSYDSGTFRLEDTPLLLFLTQEKGNHSLLVNFMFLEGGC